SQKQDQVSLDKDSVLLAFEPIWNALVEEVGGTIPTDAKGNSKAGSRSVDTSDYGLVSQQSIGSILRDRFSGEDARTNKQKKLRFSLAKLQRLETNYPTSEDFKIDIIEESTNPKSETSTSDQGDPGDQVMEDASVSDSSQGIGNGSNNAINGE